MQRVPLDHGSRPPGGSRAIADPKRKTVTIVFSDLVGSTPLGAGLDPESLRLLMLRYFEQMAAIITRHGGTVEKYIGDAVMAVFGVPQTHEDDALRAVRAALEMQSALAALNLEFERDWGVTLAARTGVNTGEVVAGDTRAGHSFAVGDAVNVAARLEQAAAPGEIVIGETTCRLVRDVATVEALAPLTVQGKPEPLAAWRVLDAVAVPERWPRRMESQLVGRQSELAELEQWFERASDTRRCLTVTVMGAAGIGKSRLVREFLDVVADRARVVEGRCVPYGEGVTFWPVTEAVRRAAGIDLGLPGGVAKARLDALLSGLPDRAAVAHRLHALLGLGESEPGIQETFWGVRRLLEHLAAAAPLVVVFDDIEWAEPTFLDLLEYLTDWVTDVPVLMCLVARPDLADLRPGWLTGKPNAATLRVGPLSGPDTSSLIQTLLHGAVVEESWRERVAAVAEGNPLFVEETLRMLVDAGALRPTETRWTASGRLAEMAIPPSIQALMAARVDQLDAEERAVAECAAVCGRVFWWGLVSELLPPDVRPRVAGHLHGLARKEFIRPDRSDLPEQDAFRFTHALLRDAAYQAIPKAARATLHERTAEWLEQRTREHAEDYEEIVGYHLEQAYRWLEELGPPSAASEALGRRASARLAAAARRAFAVEDLPGAVSLFVRAVSLLPDKDPDRLDVLPRLAFALMETGDFERLAGVVEETSVLAGAVGDERRRALAMLLERWMLLFTDPEHRTDEALAGANSALHTFQAAADDRGLAKTWALIGVADIFAGRYAEAETAWARAAGHARRAGERRDELDAVAWGLVATWAGPTPVESGLARTAELLSRVQGDRKGTSGVLAIRAALLASTGRFAEARELVARSRGLCREVGLTVWEAALAQMSGVVELLAGDPGAAERVLRPSADTLREIGEAGWLSTVLGWLAEAVYLQGRGDEALRFADECAHVAGSEDVFSGVLWRTIRARVLADRDQPADAAELAQQAVALAERTDAIGLQGDALLALAHVQRRAGRQADAQASLGAALDRYRRKGATAAARRAMESR